MINLIRVEIKKLFKNRLFYVILGLILFSAVIGVVQYFVSKGIVNDPSSAPRRVQRLKQELDSGAFNGIKAPYNGVAGFVEWMIALTVMASGIAVADFASGTIKNIISVGKRRVDVYLSKLLTMIISALIFLAANIILQTAAMTIFVGWGQAFEWDQLGPIFRMAGLEAIMFIAIAAFALMLGMLFRNTKVTIGVGFILPVGITIFERFCSLFDSMENWPKYFPHNIMAAVAVPDPTNENMVIAACVGISMIIVSTLIGIYTFEKRDINIADI